MSARATDPAYLRYQYGDSEKLRIRLETHQHYSERPDDWQEWITSQVDPRPGLTLLDVGCGPGSFHLRLAHHGMRIVGVDASPGMTREARQQANHQQIRALILQGDAQALPIADQSCDRAMALHMLFHVPDVLRALREIRRALRPGGRVVISTNASDHALRFFEVHCEAARELGYTPTQRASASRFSLDDLPLVRSVFPSAQRFVRPDAFVFPTVEPVLRYYATSFVDAINGHAADGSHRPALMALMAEKIAAIIAREGVFRAPKNAGCFVAEV
jgi:ubiquinone/menaquinone biosynthesis C-methylase UbiE